MISLQVRMIDLEGTDRNKRVNTTFCLAISFLITASIKTVILVTDSKLFSTSESDVLKNNDLKTITKGNLIQLIILATIHMKTSKDTRNNWSGKLAHKALNKQVGHSDKVLELLAREAIFLRLNLCNV